MITIRKAIERLFDLYAWLLISVDGKEYDVEWHSTNDRKGVNVWSEQDDLFTSVKANIFV